MGGLPAPGGAEVNPGLPVESRVFVMVGSHFSTCDKHKEKVATSPHQPQERARERQAGAPGIPVGRGLRRTCQHFMVLRSIKTSLK